MCGIAALGIDHEAFLLAPEEGTPDIPLERIAFEKSGHRQAGGAAGDDGVSAARGGEHRGGGIGCRCAGGGARAAVVEQRDRARFRLCGAHGETLYADPPALPGAHQRDNAALAVAMLRHQPLLPVSDAAINRGTGQRPLAGADAEA